MKKTFAIDICNAIIYPKQKRGQFRRIPVGRPIAATKKDQPVSYLSVTVRLPHDTITALDKIDKGKRADFIRMAIDEKLKREGITAPAQESSFKGK